MSRFKKILKWSLITIGSLALLLFAFGYWFMSLMPDENSQANKSSTLPESLPYLSENHIPYRGKILAVVTSTETMGNSGKKTGYELTELSRAYYVFQANGFEVDIASPKGGNPPVVIDDDDVDIYDFAFLNDSVARQKVENTLAMSEVDASAYQAVYFVGGKGAMYDFPDNQYIQLLVSNYYQSGKVIGAVCHGPAALVNVSREDGRSILEGKSISCFTNQEELFLIPEAEQIFPFLLEDRLVEQGAKFSEGTMYLENVVQDGNIVTGQNPWSTWQLAETMIEQLGYEPKKRIITPEENAVLVLQRFEDDGYSAAKNLISSMTEKNLNLNRRLLGMHSVLSAMQWKLGKALKLVWLVRHAKREAEA